jgi:hypothetical protein
LARNHSCLHIYSTFPSRSFLEQHDSFRLLPNTIVCGSSPTQSFAITLTPSVYSRYNISVEVIHFLTRYPILVSPFLLVLIRVIELDTSTKLSTELCPGPHFKSFDRRHQYAEILWAQSPIGSPLRHYRRQSIHHGALHGRSTYFRRCLLRLLSRSRSGIYWERMPSVLWLPWLMHRNGTNQKKKKK